MDTMEEVPKIRTKVFTEKINVAVTPEMKQALEKLKLEKAVDVPSWIRRLLADNLPVLQKKIEEAS